MSDERMIDRDYVSVADASESIGVTPQTIHKWIKKGYLRAIKFPGATGYRIDVDSLEAFLKSREIEARVRVELGREGA